MLWTLLCNYLTNIFRRGIEYELLRGAKRADYSVHIREQEGPGTIYLTRPGAYVLWKMSGF